jgi:2-keto-3-deoxy-L-rhamnonate aldolase RhmA
MRNSKVLARLRTGKAARFTQLTHYIPLFVAASAGAGYDGIWLDLEHHPMDQRELQSMLAFCHLYDIDCMVRPPTREKTRLYRILEDGAAGLLVPHVSTPGEVRDLVSKVKFPPVGDRGVEGFGLEANFGMDLNGSPAALVDHAQRETFLFVQIETPQGLANVDAIAAVPGIDGLYIGPFDLALRMAHEPEDRRLGFDDVMARVAAAASSHGIWWGSFATTTEEVRAQYKRGARLLVWGADFFLLKDGVARTGHDLDALLDE